MDSLATPAPAPAARASTIAADDGLVLAADRFDAAGTGVLLGHGFGQTRQAPGRGWRANPYAGVLVPSNGRVNTVAYGA